MAHSIFNKKIGHNGLPKKVVIDKRGTNALSMNNINIQFWFTARMLNLIEVLQVNYLRNSGEQRYQKSKIKR
ncbi:hypothetical protein [Candidatus Enterovibrio escicola]|uniref:hypothetical protein n=1 Tax=Candidatus Enterovibrio escicola TaxID=1927127 RepID=UPI000BE3B5EB